MQEVRHAKARGLERKEYAGENGGLGEGKKEEAGPRVTTRRRGVKSDGRVTDCQAYY